jgi:tetratricopeptide (TPR) repeat protein
MRRPIVLIFLVAALGGLLFFLTEGRRPPDWTTSSPAALEEFLQCLEAEMKLYTTDAEEHCRKALELDPEFVAARLEINGLKTRLGEDHDCGPWLEEISARDLSYLSPREQFLVRYELARHRKDTAAAKAELNAFLQRHPKDPYGLRTSCMAAATPEEAEACYRKLIEVEPNFVLAQNYLGYLAMGQGRFAEAEERFRTYQYLAPDQANPHDSLGELLLLLGRYQESEAELREALALRPDFVASYGNLLQVATLQGDFAKAERVLEEAKKNGLDERFLTRSRCSLTVDQALLEGDWEQVWQQEDACRNQDTFYNNLLRFRADLWTGRLQDAAKLERMYAHRLTDRAESMMYGGNAALGLSLHVKGIRLAACGQLQEALASLEEADRWLPYVGFSRGSIKLQNLLTLTHVLESLGRDGEAAQVRAAVRSVNPDFLKFEPLCAVPQLSPEQAAELSQAVDSPVEAKPEVP